MIYLTFLTFLMTSNATINQSIGHRTSPLFLSFPLFSSLFLLGISVAFVSIAKEDWNPP